MAGRRTSLRDVTERLLLLDPDVVALQEVDQNVARRGNVDQPAVVGEALGALPLFLPAIELEGGRYGIAILSRLGVAQSEPIPLTNHYAAEPRVALRATLCASERCFSVLNHHADYVAAAAEVSLFEVLAAAKPLISSGIAIVGDFNQLPSDAGPRAYAAAGLTDVVTQFGFEAPTYGDRRIDFDFMDAALASCVVRAGVTLAPESDHNAVVVDIDPELCSP